MKRYDVYYDDEVEAWTYKGTSRLFPDEATAKKAANNAAAHNSLFSVSYDDLYGTHIKWKDTAHIGSPDGTAKGTTKGAVFMEVFAFSSDGFMNGGDSKPTFTLQYIFDVLSSISGKGVKEFITILKLVKPSSAYIIDKLVEEYGL